MPKIKKTSKVSPPPAPSRTPSPPPSRKKKSLFEIQGRLHDGPMSVDELERIIADCCEYLDEYEDEALRRAAGETKHMAWFGVSVVKRLQPPPPPPPQTLGLSPITFTDIQPTENTAEALGFSTIDTVHSEEPSPEPTAYTSPEPTSPPAATSPTAAPTTRSRKRKGKKPSPQDAYAIKRQLSDEEARKIASATPPAPADTPAGSTPATIQDPGPPTPAPKPPTPTPGPHPRPRTAPQSPKARPHPPTRPDNITSRQGIVVHGIALRKDLENVKRWLEASNKDIGRITGIRWLRKKTILMEEGKQTSSVVVYLETPTESGKVRLGARWLQTSVYEAERGRK